MSSYSYLVAWAWYLGAVIGLSLVWWRITRGLPEFWKHLVRALPVAWALVPWSVAPDQASLAPAWLVMIFEGVLRDGGNAWRAGKGLLLATLLALLPVLALWLYHRRPVLPAREAHRGS